MYEARQNKEKVSRRIDAGGGGARQRVKTNKNRTIQGVFVPTNPYDTFQGGEINRAKNYISQYHPDLLDPFKEAEQSPEKVELDVWLMKNIYISMKGIDESWRRMEQQKRYERCLNRDGSAILPLPHVYAFYGEEDGSGALASIRAHPIMTRLQNRVIMTTNRNSFPNDKRTQRNINEFIARGGEILTGIDVTKSLYDDNNKLPFNLTDVIFYYPRNNRGVSPSTAQITNKFVDRESEAGQGILTLPSRETYGGNSQVIHRLYGANKFKTTMEQTGMYVAEVGPGPESKLAVFGYMHRRTGKTESIDNLLGSTMTLTHGNGTRNIEDYYDKNFLRRNTNWTRKEDDKLNQAVSLYGNNNWKIVSDMVGTRNRTQCAQRWMRVLNPKLSFESWTADEDQKLLAIVKEYGVKNWIKIAKKKGNRSDVQCRNRYNQIIQG